MSWHTVVLGLFVCLSDYFMAVLGHNTMHADSDEQPMCVGLWYF